MNKVRIVAALSAVFAMLLATSACTVRDETPRDLKTYLSQTADWAECDADLLNTDIQSKIFKSAEVACSSILVPATYVGNAATEDFSIQMMRIHVAKDSDFLGTIFINPGGPGGSGIEQVQYSDFPKSLLAHYDIIGFDPRGVGASDFSDGTEIKCNDELDYTTYFVGEDSPSNEEELRGGVKASDDYYQDCVTNNPLWWTLSTAHVVVDLEVMRYVVTGDKPLNYIGSSYGTTIAGMYVTKYPKQVGKIVLDSPTTVDEHPIDSALEDAKGMEAKLTTYLKGYAKHAKISFEKAWSTLLEMRQLADDNQLIGFAGIEVSSVDSTYLVSRENLLIHGIHALNYFPEDTAQKYFNQSMDDLVKYHWNGNFEWFALNMDGYDANSLEGKSLKDKDLVRDNSYEVMAIVNSMDYKPADWTTDEQKTYDKKYEQIAPMWRELNLDSSGYQYFGKSIGLDWGDFALDDPKIPDPPAEPVKRSNTSGKPLLVIGSINESVTPFQFAKDTAKLLKSPLISVKSSVHAPAASYNVTCLNNVIIKYFVTDEPIESQTCTK
jgi:pimeloyl-ACP methyl ester carboxylesterase